MIPGTVLDWQAEEGVRAYLLEADGVPVGYGELWVDEEEDEVELARLIVDGGRRREGHGRALAAALTREALGTGLSDVFIRVHPRHETAMHSYSAVGYVPVAEVLQREWNEIQPVDYAWLRYPSK